MTTGRKNSNSAQPAVLPDESAPSAVGLTKPSIIPARSTKTRELSGDELFPPRHAIPSLKTPSVARTNVGARREIGFGGAVPPAPSAPSMPPANDLDSSELDFEFSAPMEAFAPRQTSRDDDSDEGPSLQLDGDDDASEQPEPVVASRAPLLTPGADMEMDFSSPIPTESDLLDLDFADMVGGQSLGDDESDELFLSPSVSVAPLSHYANISTSPPARNEPSTPSPGPHERPIDMPSVEPLPRSLAPAQAIASSLPAPPPTPSASPPVQPSNSGFSAQRQAERVERAWSLIENSQFDEALDVMEVLRASGETDEVRSLQRSLDERMHEHRLELLGGPSSVLTVVTGSAMLRSMNIDPRAAFVFSLVDGVSSVEDLCDIANLPPTQTVLFLVDLVERGLLR